MSKQPNRPRLGRGLSSLLSLSDESENASSNAVMNEVPSNPGGAGAPSTAPPSQQVQPTTPWRLLALEKVVPNPHQPRRTMNDASLAELAVSLKANGLIQPIVVRAVDDGYQLIAGERRYRAAKLAGFDQIPAIVRQVDAYTQAQLALVENIHREDLNPLERAMAYNDHMTKLGLTQAELASRLGEQRSSVANYLRLLELAEPVRTLVRDSKLSMGHAKVLAGIADIAEQERLANVCVAQDLSVRTLERLLSAPSASPVVRTPVSAHLKELETNLSRELGLRVQVRGAAKKGRVIIHYNNLDQFDELLRKLNVEIEST